MYSNKIPAVEVQRATETSDQPDDDSHGDRLVNNLIYKQPKALSLAKTRTQVKQFFQRSDYLQAQGQTAVIDWNTGGSYIDVGNSYLTFTITAEAPDQAEYTFGCASVMNIINRLTIRTRSGTEVERLESAGLWSRIDTGYSMPENWLTTVGSLMGMGSAFTPTGQPLLTHNPYYTKNTVGSPTTVYQNTFIIPLKQLCPFFRPLKGQLLPPQLASGLHMELVFEQPATSFVKTGAPIVSYDVTNISFVLDTVDLSDETQKALNMESAESGLEWVTPRIYTAITANPPGQSQTSIQLRKSCSQATMAYTVLQNTNVLNSSVLDSMRSVDLKELANFNWQYRIGSLFFPQQPVVEANGFPGYDVNFPASYYASLYSFDKPKHPYAGSQVSLSEYSKNQSIFAMSASKNDDLFLSGLPINNSRVLEFNFSSDISSVNDRRFVSFLEYIQVTKCWVDNCSVAI